jgi:hypothetical protein
MTPAQVDAEIAKMKAMIAQQKKQQSVSNIESKPMPKKALAFARLAHMGQTASMTARLTSTIRSRSPTS